MATVGTIIDREKQKLAPIIEKSEEYTGDYRKFLFKNGKIRVIKREWEKGYIELYITKNQENYKNRWSARIHVYINRRGISLIEYGGVFEVESGDEFFLNLASFDLERLNYAGLTDYTGGQRLIGDDELGDSLLDCMERELTEREMTEDQPDCDYYLKRKDLQTARECLKELRELLTELELTKEQLDTQRADELKRVIKDNGIPNIIVIRYLAEQYGITTSDLETFLKAATISRDNQPGEVLEQ